MATSFSWALESSIASPFKCSFGPFGALCQLACPMACQPNPIHPPLCRPFDDSTPGQTLCNQGCCTLAWGALSPWHISIAWFCLESLVPFHCAHLQYHACLQLRRVLQAIVQCGPSPSPSTVSLFFSLILNETECLCPHFRQLWPHLCRRIEAQRSPLVAVYQAFTPSMADLPLSLHVIWSNAALFLLPSSLFVSC